MKWTLEQYMSVLHTGTAWLCAFSLMSQITSLTIAGWETTNFWHPPELGSLLNNLYKIPLAHASFPLAHWAKFSLALVSGRALVFQSVFVYSIVHSGADQRKHQNSGSLAFVQGIHRWPVNSPHKWPVTRKMFSFDDITVEQTMETPMIWNAIAQLIMTSL